jgi:hypothetical protein
MSGRFPTDVRNVPTPVGPRSTIIGERWVDTVPAPNTASSPARSAMNMIYNSPNYCVVEFKSAEGEPFAGGYEIMDKAAKREIFLGGVLAEKFRFDVTQLIATEPSIEEVDDFLSNFEGLMQQPLVLH